MKSALILGLAFTANAISTDQYDNELIIAPTDHFENIKQYPRNVRFDEDGRELFAFKIPRYRNLTNRFPGVVFDDEADDELMMSPFRRRPDDAEARKIFDDEELFLGAHGKLAKPKKTHPGLDQFTKKHPEVVLDNQIRGGRSVRTTPTEFVDDELIKPPKRPQGNNVNIQRDDDEFLVRSVADEKLHSSYRMSSQSFVEKQRKAKDRRENNEADDELMLRPPSSEPHYVPAPGVKPTLFINRQKPAVVRNDDELAYLGELIKEAPFDGAIFRVFDDELRAEKVNHLKGEKMDNFKDDEMFEIRGKVRPFLPFS